MFTGSMALIFAIAFAPLAYAQSDTLAGAKYDVVDRFSVNMPSGQVQVSQTPLSIGESDGVVAHHLIEYE